MPDPNYPLFEIGLLPGNRLPGRIEYEITRVPEQLDAIAAGFEAVEKMRLTDAVLAGTGFDLDVILSEQIRDIQQVLRIAVPVADVMESTTSACGIPHQRNIVSERRGPDPGAKL